MAKRYIEKKKGKVKYIVFLIIIIVVFVYIAMEQKWFGIINENKNISEKTKQEEYKEEETDKIIEQIHEKVENKNEPINANLLNPEELNNTLIQTLNNKEQESYIIKIHYKLKKIDIGYVDVYYNVNNNIILKLTINVNNKIVESMEEYDDENLLRKNKIESNLAENIEEDFNRRFKNIENENTIVNIIITNTEVVINSSIESANNSISDF